MRVAPSSKLSRIDADLLIPGRGCPIADAALVFNGPKIQFVGEQDELPPEYQRLVPVQRVRVLMPGLWDCHVHFLGVQRYDLGLLATTPAAVAGLRIARDAVATLNAGVTSVRELGGYGVQVAQVVGEGWLPGPHIYSAVSLLSPTAGHGDARNVPLHELWDKIEHADLPSYVCDGVAECTKAVRVQVRRGASVIKVATSGGVSSSGDDIMAQSFSDEELSAIVAEARRARIAVAAHCHGPAGIKAALRAGCDTIEHATFLDTDEEALHMLRDSGAILVATRGTLEFAIRHPEDWSPEQYAQLQEIKEHHERSYRKAIAAGVPVALGTDIATSSGNLSWTHGMNAVELRYAIDAGLDPLRAIEAATASAPLTLGPKAPKSGLLAEGYDADFIALDKNPLEDVNILADAANVLFVWKGGKLHKADGQPINILG